MGWRPPGINMLRRSHQWQLRRQWPNHGYRGGPARLRATPSRPTCRFVTEHSSTRCPWATGGFLATASTTLTLQTITLDSFGAGYTRNETVTITDPTGTLATATALTDFGMVTAINLTNPGSGYLTKGGIKKFVDTFPRGSVTPSGQSATLPDCRLPASSNNLGQHIPIAVADTATFTTANGFRRSSGTTTESPWSKAASA